MTRLGPHIDMDFLIAFHALVITASAATAIWATSEPDAGGNLSAWQPVVVWLGLAMVVIQFRWNRSWWRPAALVFVVTSAMIAAGLRGG